MSMVIRVAVIDKHPLFRDGVSLALNSQPDVEVVGQGESAWDAIRISGESSLNVIVVDANTLGRSMDSAEAILRHNHRSELSFSPMWLMRSMCMLH